MDADAALQVPHHHGVSGVDLSHASRFPGIGEHRVELLAPLIIGVFRTIAFSPPYDAPDLGIVAHSGELLEQEMHVCLVTLAARFADDVSIDVHGLAERALGLYHMGGRDVLA